MEELLGRELPVEDVAADQPVLLLHLVGPDDLPVEDRALEVRRQLRIAVDHAIGEGFQLLRVRLGGPFARHPLREQRHDVEALWAQRAVERRGDDRFGERPLRRVSRLGVLEPLFEVAHG